MAVVGSKLINDHLILYFKNTKMTDPELLRQVEAELLLRVEKIHLGQKVVVNFDGVELASSKLVGMMIAVKKIVTERLGNLALCRVGEHLMEVLRLTRLDRQFVIRERMRDIVGDVVSTRPVLATASIGPRGADPNWID
jgi:anti-anti-sigma regulatory factor